MQEIAQICPAEPVRFNPARFYRLVERQGPRGAEQALNRALERITVGVRRVERSARRGDLNAVCQDSSTVALVSEEFGFTSLHVAALAVQDASESRDPAAISATVARLVRVGEGSLTSAWDICGLSI